MKKVFLTLMAFVFIFTQPLYAAKVVNVSAVVGAINVAPTITVTVPAHLSDPAETLFIEKGTAITLGVVFADTTPDNITVTVAASAGTSSLESGSITSGSLPSTQYFTYLSSLTASTSETLTITVNDGTTVTTRVINVYVY